MSDLESQLLKACEDGYLLALQLPFEDALRFRNQATLCRLRDAIATARGLEGELVQNSFEEMARERSELNIKQMRQFGTHPTNPD